MPRTLTIFCDGGLGNRLGTLAGGLVTAEMLSCGIVVSWPQNNWCGCKFTDLFATDIQSNTQNIFQVFESNVNNIFMIHENQTTLGLEKQFDHSLASLEKIKNMPEDIVYYHNKIPPIYDRKQIVNAMQQLAIKKSISNKVKNFIKNHAIDNTVTGLHLRKTDMVGLDEEKFYRRVSAQPDQKYFVCSDDPDTQERFSELPNVVSFPKRNYAKKLKPGDWRTATIDTDGRPSKYNVARGMRSVQQAFVDLLILSRTSMQFTIKSSFSVFAGIYAEMPVLPCQA